MITYRHIAGTRFETHHKTRAYIGLMGIVICLT